MLQQRPNTAGSIFSTVAVTLVCLCSAGAVETERAADIEPLPPKGFAEVGGSNYVMFHVGEAYRKRFEKESWFRPGVLHPIVGTFHLQNRNEVREQLAAMHRGGQRKIALLVWLCHLPDGVETDGVYGHTVASNGGALLPQHAQNLRDFLQLLRETEYFNALNFRFALQGVSSPDQWETWDEALYRENWEVLISIRTIVQENMVSSGMDVVYDLGAELGGSEAGQARAYVRRLWGDYTSRFGAEDTYGFSVALYPGRVRRLLEDLDGSGDRPSAYALDVYDHVNEWLGEASREFRGAGIDRPRVIIQETYYNDPTALRELQRAQKDHGLEFLYLMQWPCVRDYPVPHFSVDFPAEYDAYATFPPAPESDSQDPAADD